MVIVYSKQIIKAKSTNLKNKRDEKKEPIKKEIDVLNEYEKEINDTIVEINRLEGLLFELKNGDHNIRDPQELKKEIDEVEMSIIHNNNIIGNIYFDIENLKEDKKFDKIFEEEEIEEEKKEIKEEIDEIKEEIKEEIDENKEISQKTRINDVVKLIERTKIEINEKISKNDILSKYISNNMDITKKKILRMAVNDEEIRELYLKRRNLKKLLILLNDGEKNIEYLNRKENAIFVDKEILYRKNFNIHYFKRRGDDFIGMKRPTNINWYMYQDDSIKQERWTIFNKKGVQLNDEDIQKLNISMMNHKKANEWEIMYFLMIINNVNIPLSDYFYHVTSRIHHQFYFP